MDLLMPRMFPWFIAISTILLVLFSVITFLVGHYSRKIYKIVEQRQLKIFSYAFFLFSCSYIIQLIIHVYVRTQFPTHFKGMRHVIEPFRATGLMIEIIFFTLGLALLTYMTLKTKDKKVFFLITGLLAIIIFTSFNILETYHLTSSLLLAFISYFYFKNYKRHKQKQTLIVFTAFVFLMLGHMNFIFSINYALFNLLGSILALIAYLLILTNLIITLRK